MSNYDRQNTWLSLQPITGVKFSDGTTQTTAHSSDDATPEGTSVKSTTNSNEAVTKFLRADGDGTCSWQNPSVGVSGAFWSSDWVNEDEDSVAVANGATLTFTHSLGSTDVTYEVFINGSATDSGAQEVGNQATPGIATYGAYITDTTTDAITIQLGDAGFLSINSSGASTVTSFGAAASDYIKVHVIAGGVDATTITPEGTSVKSTTNSNETLGKVLTADGDGTSSWQAPSTGSHHHYITRSTMGSGTATTAATSVSISSEVAAAAASTGWTPSVAIIELYADITRSPTGAEHLILKVGDDSSMSHYAHVEARLYSGSRDDAAATASPTNQATVPIGGSAGSEVLYHSAAKSSGGTASWKWDLVGFVK